MPIGFALGIVEQRVFSSRVLCCRGRRERTMSYHSTILAKADEERRFRGIERNQGPVLIPGKRLQLGAGLHPRQLDSPEIGLLHSYFEPK